MLDELRQLVWSGRILVQVVIDEPCSIGRQEYLLETSRVSYLPLYLPELLEYFGPYLDKTRDGEWWFECDGEALITNRPIGLLHDKLVGEPTPAPWVVHLRRGGQPNTLLLNFNDEETLKASWVNAFKESAYIRDGNAKAVMSLSKEDQEALWRSISKPEASSVFWGRLDALLSNKRAADYNVPIRVYEQGRTVHNLHSRSTRIGELSVGASDSDGSAGAARFRTHGITLPANLSLGEVYPGLTYPDGFLHFVRL